MEHVTQLHIERLSEGVYLATSDEIQGLVAQGRTIQETIEIARDVARKLLEAAADRFLAPGACPRGIRLPTDRRDLMGALAGVWVFRAIAISSSGCSSWGCGLIAGQRVPTKSGLTRW